MLGQVRQTAASLKRHASYTLADGEDFGIVAQTEPFDPVNYKPKFKAAVLPGSVLIEFFKGQADGVNIYCRLKGQSAWKFVARDTNSPYEDFTPVTQPGMAEVREYVIRAVIKDREIGQMSDIVSVAFGG